MDKLTNFSLNQLDHEKDVLKYWQDNNTYNKVLEQQNLFTKEFDFMDGPPFPNGNLHLGHIAVGSLKDVFQRYKHMHEFKCSNHLGLDTHGLPIESIIMKLHNIETSADIEKMGIKNFNQSCKDKINEFAQSFSNTYDSIGRWANFNKVYKTMDTNFMETVWWIFKTMHERNLIYNGFRIMPYSYGCETPLSNFEAGSNYKEIDTRTIYVAFKSKSMENTYFVAWTTTPWTLPSNLALCVNPKMNYVICTCDSRKYILAESSVHNLKLEFTSIENFGIGNDLVGLEYEPLFNYFENISLNVNKLFRILSDDYVKDSSDIGSGIVHIAPSFGEDDCRVCIQNNLLTNKDLNLVCPVNNLGRFTEQISEYKDMLVFDTDKLIIKNLSDRNLVLRTQNYKHQYPFCYRTETPLIYKVVSSFFVETTKMKDRMIELNSKINWSKKEIGTHRFNNWLEQVRDWSISRNRFFGTPIPVWTSEDGSESIVIGSVDELMKLANLTEVIKDIHRESIDDIIIISKTTGNILRRVTDVFDCWFESGSVPYGQIHYPFENSHAFDDKEYLCDFICEGLDQTRGWFYTLLVIACAISDKPPFKNVICTGLVLDSKGQKISKKLGNYVDVSVLLNKYGADVLRLYLLKSGLMYAEPLSFNEKQVNELFLKIIPFVNGVKFFLEHYINSVKTNNIKLTYDPETSNLMDKWILEQVYLLRQKTESCIDKYDVSTPVHEMLNFIENLTNWYIKFNRDRLKGLLGLSENETSLSCLYTVIVDFVKIIAPYMPFLTEHIWQCLSSLPNSKTSKTSKNSIHEQLYPTSCRKYNMNESFEKLQKISKLIRTLRDSSSSHSSIKTPIKSCSIYHYKMSYLKDIQEIIHLIQDEMNCLEFNFNLISKEMIKYTIKPNVKTLGQQYKKLSGDIQKKLLEIPQNILEKLYYNEIIYINLNSTNYKVTDELYEESRINKDIIILDKSYFDINISLINTDSHDTTKIIEDESLLFKVDLTLDKQCWNTYLVKSFISFIQNFRKINNFRPWDKIKLLYTSESHFVDNLFTEYSELILQRLNTSIEKIEKYENPDYIETYNFIEFDKITEHNITVIILKNNNNSNNNSNSNSSMDIETGIIFQNRDNLRSLMFSNYSESQLDLLRCIT